MGTRPNVRICPAVKLRMADIHRAAWSATTHMTADDMCAFARDLFDAAHRAGLGAARMVDGMAIGITCLGWTPEGLKKHTHEGLALFKEVTAQLFQEHFEVSFKPQLGLLQEEAWRLLDARAKREYMMCAISGCDGPVRNLYNEHHPAFVLLLERQAAPAGGKRKAAARGAKKRAREGGLPSEEGGQGSEAAASSA